MISRDGLRRGNERDVIDARVHPCRRDNLLVVELVAPLVASPVAAGERPRLVLAAIARLARQAAVACVRGDFALEHPEHRAQCG